MFSIKTNHISSNRFKLQKNYSFRNQHLHFVHVVALPAPESLPQNVSHNERLVFLLFFPPFNIFMMNLYGQYFSANCGRFPFPVMRFCLFHPLTPLPPGDVNICKHINMLKHTFLLETCSQGHGQPVGSGDKQRVIFLPPRRWNLTLRPQKAQQWPCPPCREVVEFALRFTLFDKQGSQRH